MTRICPLCTVVPLLLWGCNDGGGSSADAGPLGFTPSNFTLSGLDLSQATDVDLTADCSVRTGPGSSQDCFSAAIDTIVTQSDGSSLHVLVVKSLKVEPQTHVVVSDIQGNLPLALVSLGNLTLLGSLDAHSTGSTAVAGGFQAASGQAGAGPGGGAAAVGTPLVPGVGANGGSSCGRGGQGAVEMGATGSAPAASAPDGTATLVPLRGGSSGGGGFVGSGAGGGALQLVAGGTLTLGTSAFITVGGGGGPQGGVSGEEAGGGGSGGSLLIEANSVVIDGTLAANGGGGGGSSGNGQDGAANASAASGGAGDSPGGAGAAGAVLDGTAGVAATGSASAAGGAGGAGRIRINSRVGGVDLSHATVSPAASTVCVSQGLVH